MTTRWTSVLSPRGEVLQSAVPTGSKVGAAGLSLRGVVVQVYTYGDTVFPRQNAQANAVYVDVLLYGQHNHVLPRVLWTDPVAGMHEGAVTLPRAATLEIDSDLDIQNSKPQSLDGHHVIVSFLENDIAQPYVVACFRHPSSDVGNSAKPLGQRMRILGDEPVPAYWKHRGSFFGLSGVGDFILDTREAHSGDFEADGKEPSASQDGTNGNVTLDLQPGSTITVRHGTNVELVITEANGALQLTQTGDLTVQTAGNTNLATDGTVKIGTGASHPLIYGDVFQTQQAPKNVATSDAHAAYAAAWTALASATTALTAALAPPPPASPPATAPALVAVLKTWTGAITTALAAAVPQVKAAAASAQITTYDASIPSHLSPDVETK